MPSLPSASLFGKLPNALDFVRINHTYPEALALDRWLAASQQYLHAHGQGWPEESLYFCFVPEGADHGLVGVLAPSQDRAGRKYPVAIFSPVPRSVLDAHYPAVPVAAAQYLAAATALLERAATVPRAELVEHMTHMPRFASQLAEVYAALNRQLSPCCGVDGLEPQSQTSTAEVAAHWLWQKQQTDPASTPTFVWHPETTRRPLLIQTGNAAKLLSSWPEK